MNPPPPLHLKYLPLPFPPMSKKVGRFKTQTNHWSGGTAAMVRSGFIIIHVEHLICPQAHDPSCSTPAMFSRGQLQGPDIIRRFFLNLFPSAPASPSISRLAYLFSFVSAIALPSSCIPRLPHVSSSYQIIHLLNWSV